MCHRQSIAKLMKWWKAWFPPSLAEGQVDFKCYSIMYNKLLLHYNTATKTCEARGFQSIDKFVMVDQCVSCEVLLLMVAMMVMADTMVEDAKLVHNTSHNAITKWFSLAVL